ncbi:phosphotransferase [Streptomyces silvisoli]|uniref:Phosphotransferase n=1 Tax=Streptomyces silvisoli TaxID=3034235 RepID=A0ABT5ZJY8_9ACTN|nr:phosphotransferase [Streptomyces silvisoli]MDF3290142.1 phosphotransferase [Streptomyces silvisoli]
MSALLHRQAGQLIRLLHDATPKPAVLKEPARTFIHRAVNTLEIQLLRCSRFLSAEEEALVRELAATLGSPEMGDLPTGYCHGDNRPRNWSWHDSHKTAALLHFERCEPNLRLRDIARLAYGPWIHRDDLREAYLDGYGQDLTDVERAALPAFAALDALNSLRFGHVALDTEAILRARVALAHLMEESSPA